MHDVIVQIQVLETLSDSLVSNPLVAAEDTLVTAVRKLARDTYQGMQNDWLQHQGRAPLYSRPADWESPGLQGRNLSLALGKKFAATIEIMTLAQGQ
jgi:hypothetical protein